MTIEFYKRKRKIQAWKKDILKSMPPKSRKSMRVRLKIVKVKVVDSKKLRNCGGRRIGGKSRFGIRKGEVGYVFAWPKMKKEAGLQKVR